MENITNSSTELFLAIQTLINTQFGIPLDKIVPTANLGSDLDLDSIDLIDLLSVVGDRYSIDLSPHEFEGIVTLEDLVARFQVILVGVSTKHG